MHQTNIKEVSMILGLCGSGRKEGNTGALVEAVLQGAGGPSELIWLIDLNIGYCTGCLRCAFEGKCWQQDGMTDLYRKLIDSDAIVYGSPCYYGNVSGLFKSCLLYTSPSPRDRQKSRMPSSA